MTLRMLYLGKGASVREQGGEMAARHRFFSLNRFFPKATEVVGGDTVNSQKATRRTGGVH